MPFDWRDLFLLAHELRKETVESKRRTSIGRAYYYVYNVALIEAQRRGYYPRMPLLSRVIGGSHKKLWSWYQLQQDLNYKKLGINGATLHGRRVKVDYHDSPSPSPTEVQKQLDEARAFELLFATVTSTSPPPSLP